MSTAPKSPPIAWYRCPVATADFKALHARSDFKAWLQTLGHLGLLAVAGATVLYSARHWTWLATIVSLFCFGTIDCFLLNGIHELGHGTVFKTKALNAFFVRVYSFLGFFNFEMFDASHTRHHKYTLHPPDDLEVVLPSKVLIKDFIRSGFINPRYAWNALAAHVRIARGKMLPGWESTLFPEGDPDKKYPVNWARFLLAGHGLIFVAAMYFHIWLLPLLTTFGSFYGAWLHLLCNHTQHIGLQDDVADFRLCCRTFTVNPIVQFLYWHMNFHTEHHMYAAVPCYNLPKLHRLIKHDLPPCPQGFLATWREIAAIQALQREDPKYQHVAPLPQLAQSREIAVSH